MRRLRLVLVNEFDWLRDEFTEDDCQGLIDQFVNSPADFLRLNALPDDEEIIIEIQDITEDNA